MQVRQIIRYASFLLALSLLVRPTTAQLVPTKDIYRVGGDDSKLVMITHRIHADGSQLAIHNLTLFDKENGRKLGTEVFKVFRGPAEVTSEVAGVQNYHLPLRDGRSLVFVTGSYSTNGQPQRITRSLPEMFSDQVSAAPNGRLVITDVSYDANNQRVSIAKEYAIDHTGELAAVVLRIVRGATDITSDAAGTPDYHLPLKDGRSLVFVSGIYKASGQPQRITRILPETFTDQVSPDPNGGLLVADVFYDAENTRVSVAKKYTIGPAGELHGAVRSVKRGDADVTSSILAGELKAVSIAGSTLRFHFDLSPSKTGPRTITISIR